VRRRLGRLVPARRRPYFRRGRRAAVAVVGRRRRGCGREGGASRGRLASGRRSRGGGRGDGVRDAVRGPDLFPGPRGPSRDPVLLDPRHGRPGGLGGRGIASARVQRVHHAPGGGPSHARPRLPLPRVRPAAVGVRRPQRPRAASRRALRPRKSPSAAPLALRLRRGGGLPARVRPHPRPAARSRPSSPLRRGRQR
ncbi:hypothetical protein H632_c5308p0, partial [Helicosporidium sp. ATCC 50920]